MNLIIFYFDEYEIAAGAVGPPIVAIPLSDMNNLLSDEFNWKLKIQMRIRITEESR